MSFRVEHHCPQCGAPLFLDEADRFFRCEYCRVKSCISQKGFARYFLPCHEKVTEETPLIYLPYWRFKGVEYTCTPSGVTQRFLDISWLALDDPPPAVPFSLGFRPQAMALKRVSARTRGTFIRPNGFETSFPRKRTANGSIRFFIEDIGETVSLIFAPFFRDGERLFDAILNSPLGTGDLDPDGRACRPEKETTILPGICPACGWDLEGQSDSLALVCRNCDTLWQPRGDQLSRLRFGVLPPEGESDVLIPFWKIDGQISGVPLHTGKDLKTLANLIQTGTADDEALSFWAPAFKIRPKLFLRLSRQLTLTQPAVPEPKKIHPQTHLPVTLPATEAVQSIRLTIATLAKPLRDYYEGLEKARVKPSQATLVYLPFDAQPREYINTKFNIAIDRATLQLSGNL